MMTTSPRVGQAFGAPRAEDDYIAFDAIVEQGTRCIMTQIDEVTTRYLLPN